MPVSPSQTITVGVVDIKKKVQSSGLIGWCSLNYKAICGELISTLLLVLLGCMTCIPRNGVVPHMLPAIGFGFIVSTNIQIFGHVSGAHMNPAVTVAALIFGKMNDICLGIMYIVAQCFGAILGYGILMGVSPEDLITGGVCLTSPHTNIDAWQAIVIEIALTAALNFLNCSVWHPVNPKSTASGTIPLHDSIPLKFGLAVAGLSLAGGHLTDASMNPARSLGPAVWTGRWDYHWVYWVGPLISGVIPPLIYKHILVDRRSLKIDG